MKGVIYQWSWSCCAVASASNLLQATAILSMGDTIQHLVHARDKSHEGCFMSKVIFLTDLESGRLIYSSWQVSVRVAQPL